VKSSVHAFTYYWPTWPENVGKIPKGLVRPKRDVTLQ